MPRPDYLSFVLILYYVIFRHNLPYIENPEGKRWSSDRPGKGAADCRERVLNLRDSQVRWKDAEEPSEIFLNLRSI